MKTNCSIHFHSTDCLKATEAYVRSWLHSFEFPIVDELKLEGSSLILTYHRDLSEAEYGMTDQIEDRIVGYRDGWEVINQETQRLRAAIVKHRSQKADDRCIEDDDELYAALGDGIQCDRRVGDKDAMLANCARFIERRCEGDGWPSYAEMESERDALREFAVTISKALGCLPSFADPSPESGNAHVMQKLDEALYVPGELRCPQCRFRLHKRVLRVSDGAVGVDTSVEKEFCPNDESEMQRLTWKDADAESCATIEALMEQIKVLKEAVH
jgi:hypothetical protein